jgi:hypothetical protein
MRSKHEAHGEEDNQLATDMDPKSKVDYSLIAPADEEDLWWRFPSPAGCQEELLDPPDLGSMTAADRDIFLEK